jgi:WS/DGAT/MGAT family acyltransferase
MLRSETTRRARSAVALARTLGRSLARLAELDELSGLARERAAGLWKLARNGMARSRTPPLAGVVGPHRRVEWLTMELADLKQVKSALGGTLNDVVLAVVSGALRRFLAGRGHDCGRLDLRAAVPVNVRNGEGSTTGNRVSAWIVELPTAQPDPWRRLQAVRKTTTELKDSHQAESASALVDAADWTSPSVLGVFLQLVNRARPYDVVVTNVPGPPVPLYLLDAKMVSAYPHLPLFEGQGLGIALLSYDGRLSWGLTGEWDLMPDLADFGACLTEALAELEKIARAVARAYETREQRAAPPFPSEAARPSEAGATSGRSG